MDTTSVLLEKERKEICGGQSGAKEEFRDAVHNGITTGKTGQTFHQILSLVMELPMLSRRMVVEGFPEPSNSTWWSAAERTANSYQIVLDQVEDLTAEVTT